MTLIDIAIASFIGQIVVVAAVAFGHMVVTFWRFYQEWRADMAELRRAKQVDRLRRRIDQLQK